MPNPSNLQPHRIIALLAQKDMHATCKISSYLSKENSYQYANQEAIEHIIQTLSGLESRLMGEAEVMHQYKKALQTTYQNRHRCHQLKSLYLQAYHPAKQIRKQANIVAHHRASGTNRTAATQP